MTHPSLNHLRAGLLFLAGIFLVAVFGYWLAGWGFIDSIYMVVVTLSTVGYGDVYPVGSVARIAAVLEAFAGQIMMVVLVARLVGVHVAQSLMAPKPENAGDS